ncbi:hypothetical protein R6Q59_005937 [Mikania micrantha]
MCDQGCAIRDERGHGRGRSQRSSRGSEGQPILDNDQEEPMKDKTNHAFKVIDMGFLVPLHMNAQAGNKRKKWLVWFKRMSWQLGISLMKTRICIWTKGEHEGVSPNCFTCEIVQRRLKFVRDN